MLPSGLIRARVVQRRIEPSLVEPDKPAVKRAAEEVVDLFTEAAQAQHRLGDVLQELDERCEDRRDHRLLRGLAHLMQARCETADAVDRETAQDLRWAAFTVAAERGPLALGQPRASGPRSVATALDVLAEVGAARGWSAEQVQDALYGDLASERRIVSPPELSAEALVHRYNLALVQGLLLRATALHVEVPASHAPRLRQLFRWVKFHQLLYRVHVEGPVVRLSLDGPMSLFRGSTRYGRNLARFFPAVPLQPAPWRVAATILWTRANHRKQLEITHEHGLVTHYADTGAYRTRPVEQFVERFGAAAPGWALEEALVPLQLSPTESIFPDFVVRSTSPEAPRVAHVEVLGHWRADALKRRLEALGQDTPVVFVVSKKLGGDKAAALPDHPQVVGFADVLPTKRIVEACARIAAPTPAPREA